MGMKFTQIPTDTFEKLQLNAGILVTGFTPSTGTVSGLIGATTGGVQFQDNVTYQDFGDDIDNCPKNMLELKKIQSREVTMSGTFVTVDVSTAIKLAGAADVDGSDDTHIVPRDVLEDTDFGDVWWIGDYSDVNTGDNAGFLAVHLMNALNTGGFQIQSADKDKGKFAFTFTGHYSMDAQDTVPYEIYVQAGDSSVLPSVYLNKHAVTVNVGSTVALTATTNPAGQTVTWTSGTTGKAQVSNGTVTGVSAGSSIITAKITVNGVDYTDTCTVIVEAAS